MSTDPLKISNRRLNGWKEIASHFGRGVRTVQRWEKEFGMPVHRLPGGRKESVAALSSELEIWWRDSRVRTETSTSAPDDSSPGQAGHDDDPLALQGKAASRRAILAAVAVVTILTLGIVGGWWWWRTPGNPATWKLDHGKVHLYSEAGALLWKAELGRLLTDADAVVEKNLVAIGDLNADGASEVVIGASGRLYCFDAVGRRLFEHAVSRVARFGGVDFAGPWQLHHVAVTEGRPGGGRVLWAAYNAFTEYPTVLQKIDSRGKVLGEYWSDGNIGDVKLATVGRRRLLLVGAANNEFHSGSLVLLDPENPTATAPTVNPEYACQTCPHRDPLEFFVFPESEIEALQGNTSGAEATVSPAGLTVVVTHNASMLLEQAHPMGVTFYRFDGALRPVQAERQPAFKMVHDQLYLRKIFDHPFGPAEQASVWPVRRWTGTGFEELWPPKGQ